jgi:hypothetical protein
VCGRQRAVDGNAERDADRATKADMEKSMINAAGAMMRDPRPYRRPEFQMLFLGRQRAPPTAPERRVRAGTRSLSAKPGRLQKTNFLQV